MLLCPGMSQSLDKLVKFMSLLSQALCLLQHNSSVALDEVCWELVPEDRVARGGGGNGRNWDVDCMIY